MIKGRRHLPHRDVSLEPGSGYHGRKVRLVVDRVESARSPTNALLPTIARQPKEMAQARFGLVAKQHVKAKSWALSEQVKVYELIMSMRGESDILLHRI